MQTLDRVCITFCLSFRAAQTEADIFRIEPVTPYPTEYSPCTEVAIAEKEANARPAISGKVEKWSEYDTVFIGCPVWWRTICSFAESYDFSGKTVVPFSTYASTSRRDIGKDCGTHSGSQASRRRRAYKRTCQCRKHKLLAEANRHCRIERRPPATPAKAYANIIKLRMPSFTSDRVSTFLAIQVFLQKIILNDAVLCGIFIF